MFSPTIRPESYSRGDKTAIDLFLSGAGGWEAGLRRRIDDGLFGSQ